MPGGPPGPREPAQPGDAWAGPPADVLEGGFEATWWQRRWAGLPRAARVLLIALVVLAAIGVGGTWLSDRAAERALAQRVDLTASLGVWSSSTAPPRGRVSYFVVVRNEGARPVWVTAVDGSTGGLRLRSTGAGSRLGAQDSAVFALSVRLTCRGHRTGEGPRLRITVRRADGTTTERRVRAGSADLLLHVASALCAAHPDLRDREISGPV